jgi:NADH:ubiquinone oxidoreductase subunit E
MKMFNMQTYQNLIDEYSPVTAENLFVLVGKLQDTFGYVPAGAVRDLAAKTGVAEARIYGAVTSYKDFKLRMEDKR